MKSLTWTTFVITFALASLNMSRVAIDQPARDLSDSDSRKVQAIVETATVVKVKEMQDFQGISHALRHPTATGEH